MSALLNRSFQRSVYSKEYFEKYKDIFKSLENDGTDGDLARFAALTHSVLKFDATEELSRIFCDVLVIGAQNDAALSGEASRHIASLLGCELYMYENYGHAVYDEAPDYKKRLLDFFERRQKNTA